MKTRHHHAAPRRAPLASLIAAVLAAPAWAAPEALTLEGVRPPAMQRASGERGTHALAPAAKEPWMTAPSGGAPAGILFSADFDADCSQDPPAPPPSPPAPYATPLGFTVTNVDNRTPAANVAYVTNAWIVREDFAHNVADCAMFSTSWYSPAGAANDWAAFPAATSLTPTENTQLRWNAVTYDASYPDGYEVRYSTGGTTPADFLANPPLLSIPAENSSWTARSVTLPVALAGVPIRLAFRNNSVDKFLLVIDDIVVENLVAVDPAINVLEDASPTSQYARVPVFLQYPFDLEATVANLGTSALTDVAVEADLLVDAAPKAAFTSAPVSLAAGASADVELGTGVYDLAGQWTAEATVQSAEGDEIPSNSTVAVALLEVTGNELTRAEGATVGSLGIGAGNGGELGNDFQIPADARLTTVRITYVNGDALPPAADPADNGDGVGDWNGREMQAVVRAWNTVQDEPGEVIATLTATVPADAPIGDLVLDFPVENLTLAPGRYLLAAVEPVDQTLTVQQTERRFTPGTGWVIWPTSQFGGWANVEEFGATFSRPFRISALLAAPVPFPVAVDDAVALDEDTVITGSVAANDTASDQGGSVWSLLQGPQDGLLQLDPDGSFTYTPNAGYNGSDSFQYRLCDADDDCDDAVVDITVASVDDLPVAEDDAFVTGPERVLQDTVAGNDSAGDGASLYSLVTGPASGTLELQADGSFTYTPAAGFDGAVGFTYQLCDADADCDTAAASIEVLPVAIFRHGFED